MFFDQLQALLNNVITLIAVQTLQFFCSLGILIALWRCYFKYQLDGKLVRSLSLIPCGLMSTVPLFINRYLIFFGFIPRSYWYDVLQRFAFAGYIAQYLGIFIFFNLVLPKNFKINKYFTNFVIVLGLSVITYFILFAFFPIIPLSLFFSKLMLSIHNFLIMFSLIYIILFFCWNKNENILLKKQLKYFTAIWWFQYLPWDFIHDLYSLISFFFPGMRWYLPKYMAFVANGILISAMYFGLKRLIQLRFLNIKKRVSLPTRVKLQEIAVLANRIALVKDFDQLHRYVQDFFYTMLKLDRDGVALHIVEDNDVAAISSVASRLRGGVVVKHEIEYSLLYSNDRNQKDWFDLLQNASASVFIPLYHQDTLIAYITIDQKAFGQRLLTQTEQDEIALFMTSLLVAVTSIKHAHVSRLLEHERKSKADLVVAHKKVCDELSRAKLHNGLYQDALTEFLREADKRVIGVVEYKKHRFVYCNKEAEQLVGCSLTDQPRHPVTAELKKIVELVLHYKIPHHKLLTLEKYRLMVTALPVTGQSNVLLFMHRPDIADTVRSKIEQLTNPEDWNCAVYLETTDVGRALQRLLPSDGNSLVRCKIDLLRACMSHKYLVLQGSGKDCTKVVESLMREHVHNVSLRAQEKDDEYARMIFGVNPLLLAYGSLDEHQDPGFLERFDSNTVIHIKNIENLSCATQEMLIHYINTGLYRSVGSRRESCGSVNFVFSSTQSLFDLVKEGRLSEHLYALLQPVVLPVISELAEQEYDELVDGVVMQLLLDMRISCLVELSKKEKELLCRESGNSFSDLYDQIKRLIQEKMALIQYGQNSEVSCDEDQPLTLPYIISLGKSALKNRTIMKFLWDKFDKNQTRIATLLGVNRSSVSRRCDSYRLR